MRDPFPFASPQFLQDATTPFARATGLTTLPLHIHEVIFSILLYTFIGVSVSPWLSRLLCPRSYPRLDRRTKINWDVHVVSLFQSVFICGLALFSIFGDPERKTWGWEERLWAYTGFDGFMTSMACGYFIWDLFVTAYYINIFGWGMLAHAVAATAVFSLGFRPFVNYYAAVFLLYELSSPFNNFHWFLDKLHLTGSFYQWINGIVLILTFFFCRLVWGNINSVVVFYDMYNALRSGRVTTDLSLYPDPVAQRLSGVLADEKDVYRFTAGRPLPLWLATSYLTANVVLNSLNIYWMGKMIETIRKRFDPPFGTKGVGKGKKAKVEADGVTKEDPTIVRGIDDEGKRTVEIEGREIRSRRRA
ncbi:DUF887-domain-containing protein [Myriangium duriaei CBS 260.36]|uniref:DUF887-domain-containing protein n=1 Tax=Myriangium duriaei CBS 260.36 TaxID=1168546 RepID=A0A9P4JCL7_9PEZI|nr:DUF887-domain-containing protein [Myriangium duriaei CBS 260.36]